MFNMWNAVCAAVHDEISLQVHANPAWLQPVAFPSRYLLIVALHRLGYWRICCVAYICICIAAAGLALQANQVALRVSLASSLIGPNYQSFYLSAGPRIMCLWAGKQGAGAVLECTSYFKCLCFLLSYIPSSGWCPSLCSK